MKLPAFITRTWALGVVSAVGAVLVAYGLVDADALPLWLTLAGAILSPTAAAFIPAGKPADVSADES
jgi:hypothetical protein